MLLIFLKDTVYLGEIKGGGLLPRLYRMTDTGAWNCRPGEDNSDKTYTNVV